MLQTHEIMELYKYAKGDLMAGRKIVYLHGFASFEKYMEWYVEHN